MIGGPDIQGQWCQHTYYGFFFSGCFFGGVLGSFFFFPPTCSVLNIEVLKKITVVRWVGKRRVQGRKGQ